MKIGLYYSTTGNNNGPGKVVSNLVRGLEMCGIEVLHNQEGQYNGCLQSWGTPIRHMNPNTIVGPNLCVIPTECPWVWTRFSNMVVPSEWLKEMYETFDCIKTGITRINVWAVGIDTDKFCPIDDDKKWDVLLYVKGREEEAKEIVKFLEQTRLRVVVICYGNYTEEQLIKFARESKCCILLTKTESQGIGYQEILSMGVPCYVINKSVWDDYIGWSFPATSVPYFDERCGVIEENMMNFEIFYDGVQSYNPRQYIIDNLELSDAAKKYVSILENK